MLGKMLAGRPGALQGLSRQPSSDLLSPSIATSGGIRACISRSSSAAKILLDGCAASKRRMITCCSSSNLPSDGTAGDAVPPHVDDMPQADVLGPSGRQPEDLDRPSLGLGPDAWLRLGLPQAGSSAHSHGVPPDRPSHAGTWEFTSDDFVPSPSNLPTNEDQDVIGVGPLAEQPLLFPPRADGLGGSLRMPGSHMWTLTDQPGIDLLVAGPMAWSRLPQVYVILFGVGERDTEGIYSLRALGSDGVPHETIIAFESEEDAQRYAGLLEASMDHMPNVCSIPPRDLLNFCTDQGYSCRLEPEGSLLIPPEINVNVTDWERSLRLREGKFAVLDEEPGPTGPAHPQQPQRPQPAAATGTVDVRQAKPGASAHSLARYTALSETELESIRARLEALLPSDD